MTPKSGLFTISSLLPLPWRIFDWYNICTIARYAQITRSRRIKQHMAPLRDPNDLPDPADAEFWVGAGGERMVGPKTKSTPIPKKVKSEGASTVKTDLELGDMESRIADASETDEEAVVLTDKEEDRLRRAQIKFSKSQTWYRPHTTPTHHASPIKWALLFCILMVGNSVFQACLCGVMWGLNRWDRPAWTTAVLIVASFGCGIAAAIVVWRAGEMTKRKAEVTAAMWEMLKKDEEKLEARRKEARERHAANKKVAAATAHHHFPHVVHHGHSNEKAA